MRKNLKAQRTTERKLDQCMLENNDHLSNHTLPNKTFTFIGRLVHKIE